MLNFSPSNPPPEVIEEELAKPSFLETGTCDDLKALYKVHLATSPASTGQCRSDLFSNCPIRDYRYRLEGTHTIPTVLHALITRTDCTRHDFRSSAFIDRQMRTMGAKDSDLKGHVISPEFCGPSEWFNLAPFSPLLLAEDDNQSTGGINWQKMEQIWKRRIDERKEKIEAYIFMDYQEDSDSDKQPSRPKGFRVCSQYLEGYDTVAGEDDWYFQNGN